jgi:hypothetical protein
MAKSGGLVSVPVVNDDPANDWIDITAEVVLSSRDPNRFARP